MLQKYKYGILVSAACLTLLGMLVSASPTVRQGLMSSISQMGTTTVNPCETVVGNYRYTVSPCYTEVTMMDGAGNKMISYTIRETPITGTRRNPYSFAYSITPQGSGIPNDGITGIFSGSAMGSVGIVNTLNDAVLTPGVYNGVLPIRILQSYNKFSDMKVQIKVTVTKPPAPTVTLTTSSGIILNGAQTRFTWSSNGATACKFTEGDAQFKAYENTTSGSGRYTQSLYATQVYTIACTGNGGTTTKSVTVTVIPPLIPVTSTSATIPSPTVALTTSSSTVPYAGQTRISWSTTGATSCKFTEGDAQFKAYENTTSGSGRYTQSLYANQIYTILCTGNGGTTSKSVTITVIPPPITNSGLTSTSALVPTVTLSTSSGVIAYAGQTRLTWSSNGATACKFTEGDMQFKSYENTISGSGRYTQSLYANQIYTILCTGNGGTTSKSVTITVIPPPTPITSTGITNSGITTNTGSTPTLEIIASGSVNYGELTMVRYTGTNLLNCSGSASLPSAFGYVPGWPKPIEFSGQYNSSTNPIGPLYADTTVTVQCRTLVGSSLSKSVVIKVIAPIPTLEIIASGSVNYGDMTMIRYTGTNLLNCSGSASLPSAFGYVPGWPKPIQFSGQYSTNPVGPLYADTTIAVQCMVVDGSSISKSVVIKVIAPIPTLEIIASGSVNYGDMTMIRYTGTNLLNCTGSASLPSFYPPYVQGWPKSIEFSGQYNSSTNPIGPIIAVTTVAVQCRAVDGSSISKSVVISLNPYSMSGGTMSGSTMSGGTY